MRFGRAFGAPIRGAGRCNARAARVRKKRLLHHAANGGKLDCQLVAFDQELNCRLVDERGSDAHGIREEVLAG